jgi:hypothetical protein
MTPLVYAHRSIAARPRLAINAVHTLRIRDDAIAPDERVKTSVAVPRPHGGVRLQAFEQGEIVDRPRR